MDEEEIDQAVNTSSDQYPEIPRVEMSENIESVRRKLVALENLRAKSESVLSDHRSEKRLNEIANDDEEVDPLDAFMSENTVALADQQIQKEQSRLDAIMKALREFQKLETVLAKHQFSDSSISEAIKQRDERAARITAPEEEAVPESVSARGSGTVWESEFQKDESVPKRLKVEQSRVAPVSSRSAPVQLNVHKAGLQTTEISRPDFTAQKAVKPAVQAESSRGPSEASQKRQEELRKKLGY